MESAPIVHRIVLLCHRIVLSPNLSVDELTCIPLIDLNELLVFSLNWTKPVAVLTTVAITAESALQLVSPSVGRTVRYD